MALPSAYVRSSQTTHVNFNVTATVVYPGGIARNRAGKLDCASQHAVCKIHQDHQTINVEY